MLSLLNSDGTFKWNNLLLQEEQRWAEERPQVLVWCLVVAGLLSLLLLPVDACLARCHFVSCLLLTGSGSLLAVLFSSRFLVVRLVSWNIGLGELFESDGQLLTGLRLLPVFVLGCRVKMENWKYPSFICPSVNVLSVNTWQICEMPTSI